MNKRSGIESKKKILNAASRVFSEYGYKGASMRMIAGYAGISIGGLYLYFKNKEDLYTTLLGDMLRDLTVETRNAVKDIEDPAEAMNTFISVRVNYARKHRELILVSGREMGFTFGIKAKRAFFREQRRTIEEIVRKGIARGTFRPCRVREVAKIIVCALRGFILSIIVEPDALFSAGECGTLILEGLLTGDGLATGIRPSRSSVCKEKKKGNRKIWRTHGN